MRNVLIIWRIGGSYYVYCPSCKNSRELIWCEEHESYECGECSQGLNWEYPEIIEVGSQEEAEKLRTEIENEEDWYMKSIHQGYTPTDKLDTSNPPRGGSAVSLPSEYFYYVSFAYVFNGNTRIGRITVKSKALIQTLSDVQELEKVVVNTANEQQTVTQSVVILSWQLLKQEN